MYDNLTELISKHLKKLNLTSLSGIQALLHEALSCKALYQISAGGFMDPPVDTNLTNVTETRKLQLINYNQLFKDRHEILN